MIEVSFLQLELSFAALWLCCRGLVWLRQGKLDGQRETRLLLMYVNLAVLLRFVFYPAFATFGHLRPLRLNLHQLRPFWVNLRPLVHLSDFHVKREALINILGNIALFVPSGIILPTVYRRLDRFWKVTLAGAGLSLCLELLQLLTPRCSDVDDLILNTLGTVIGYGVFWMFRRKKEKPI